MATKPPHHPLRWVLTRPWRRPGRIVVMLGLSLSIAPLRVATIASILPVLQLLLHDDGVERLRASAADAPAALAPAAIAVAEHITAGSPEQALAWVLGFVLLLAVLRGFLTVVQESLAADLVHGTAGEIALEVHDSLLRGSGDRAPHGEILSHFSADLDAVRAALRRVYVRVLREPFHLLAALGFLLWIEWRLALWTGIAFPVGAGVLLLLSRRLKHASRRALRRTAGMLSVAEEGLRGRREVRAYGLEPRERERFQSSFGALTQQLSRLDRQQAWSSPLLEVLALVAAIACSLFGLRQVVSGELPAETFLTFYAVLLSVLDPLRKLADTHVRVQRGAAAALRLQQRVLLGGRPPAVRGTRPWPRAAALEVDGVGLEDDEGRPILDGLHLRLEPGETVLVAGASGSGKSSLLDVLAGLRAADRGAVRVGGAPLSELRPDEFRRQVALVSPHCFLFRGTLRENLTLGDDREEERLIEALEQVDLRDRVDELPEGLATRVEDVPFSAGERQRIALARALLRDPDVLLLDEATSALDRPREESILERVIRGRSQRITVLVTHRLGGRLPVDQVLILDGGRCVATGTQDELRSSSSLFRSLAEGRAG